MLALPGLAGLARDRLLAPVPSFPPHEDDEQLGDEGQAAPERVQPTVTYRILHGSGQYHTHTSPRAALR